MKETLNVKEHKWIEDRKKLEEAEVYLDDEKEQTYENEQLVPLEVNDDVILKSIQQRGVILEKLSEEEYVVQIGVMRMNVKRHEIERINEDDIDRSQRATV